MSSAFSTETLAAHWKCSRRHVHSLITRGEIHAFRIGGKLWRISRDEVTRYEQSIANLAATLQPSLSEITEATEDYEPMCGLYFLFHGDELVYIGQSTFIQLRVARHKMLKAIKFNRVAVVEAPLNELSAAEARYIVALQPSFNIARKRRMG